jgi:hypothetical protein
MPAPFAQVAGVSAVGVQRIGGDQHVIEVELVEQGGERGDLAALGVDLVSVLDQASGVVLGQVQ